MPLPPKAPSSLRHLTRFREIGILLAAVCIGAVFSALAPAFLSSYNLFNLLRQTSELGIVAMAMTILIISGEFDLSVGAIYAVGGVVTGLLFKSGACPIWLAALCGLAAALALGGLNGLLITYGRMNSFIATLATMMVYRGSQWSCLKVNPSPASRRSLFFKCSARETVRLGAGASALAGGVGYRFVSLAAADGLWRARVCDRR